MRSRRTSQCRMLTVTAHLAVRSSTGKYADRVFVYNSSGGSLH